MMEACFTIVVLIIAACIITNVVLDFKLRRQDYYVNIYNALDIMDKRINSLNNTICGFMESISTTLDKKNE